MKKDEKKRNTYTKYERRLIYVFVFLLCVFIFIKIGLKWMDRETNSIVTNVEKDSVVIDFLNSVENKESKKNTKSEPKLFFFDPNTADSLTFSRLGLKSWQISNALKYIRKGGTWRSANHFSKLYGLSEEEFSRLKPYIKIKQKQHTIKNKRQRNKVFISKYKKGTKIDLNLADTSMLKRVPGIGNYFASKIVKYRERLGGYISIGQLDDIKRLSPKVKEWFKLGQNLKIVPLKINESKFNDLLRHPYLNYEQVKSIFKYRKYYGEITSLEQLEFMPTFTSKDIERLTPYIVF